MNGVLRGPGRSLLRPRLLPLASAIVTVGALVTWIDLRLTSELFRGVAEGSVLRQPDDEIGHALYTAINNPASGGPAVVVLGGSAMRDAYPAPEEMARRLRSWLERPVPFVQLSYGGQTLTESLQLFDAANAPRGSVAVLDLSANRVRMSVADAVEELADPYLPFLPDSALVRLIRQAGGSVPWEPALVRNRDWIHALVMGRLKPSVVECLRDLRNLHTGGGCPRPVLAGSWFSAPAVFHPPVHSDFTRAPSVKDSMASVFRHECELRAKEDAALSAAVVRAVIEHARSRGITVILMRLPEDSRAQWPEEVFAGRFDMLSQLAARTNTPMVDLRHLPGFVNDDFIDLHHLLPAGRAKFASVFQGVLRQYWDVTRRVDTRDE